MNGLNQVILEGNVVRVPEVKTLSTGSKVCTMPIAVSRSYKDSKGEFVDEVGYYDIESWGEQMCNVIEKQGFKGRGVRVVGRLKQNRWTGTDGKSASKVLVVAEHVDFKFMKKTDAKASDHTTKDDLENAAQGIRDENSEVNVF